MTTWNTSVKYRPRHPMKREKGNRIPNFFPGKTTNSQFRTREKKKKKFDWTVLRTLNGFRLWEVQPRCASGRKRNPSSKSITSSMESRNPAIRWDVSMITHRFVLTRKAFIFHEVGQIDDDPSRRSEMPVSCMRWGAGRLPSKWRQDGSWSEAHPSKRSQPVGLELLNIR